MWSKRLIPAGLLLATLILLLSGSSNAQAPGTPGRSRDALRFPERSRAELNGNGLAPGLYLIRLTQGGQSLTRKACVVR